MTDNYRELIEEARDYFETGESHRSDVVGRALIDALESLLAERDAQAAQIAAARKYVHGVLCGSCGLEHTATDELYKAIYYAAEGVIVDERGITSLGLSDDVAEAVETVVLGFFASDRIRERVKTAIEVAQDSEGDLLYQIPTGAAGRRVVRCHE